MHTRHPVPGKEQIALLDPFDRLGLDRIHLVHTAAQAERARCAGGQPVLGLDTESRPTLPRARTEGPHRAVVHPGAGLGVPAARPRLQRGGGRAAGASRHRQGRVRAGDDRKRIQARLGVEVADILSSTPPLQQRGYRKDLGVKTAVAVLFQRRFIKSKKAATSNWAQRQLSEAQLVYAANDAYAAARLPGAGAGGLNACAINNLCLRLCILTFNIKTLKFNKYKR